MNRFQVKEIPLELIDDFPDHPYRVRDDSSMIELTQSIIDNGVLVPAIVRPKRDGRYEMISGHRRRRASQLAGIDKLKCIVGDYDDLTAIVIMVDSNLHRENVLPSEKAFAYKMRLEAMNVQGQRNDLTSTPLVSKCRTNELLVVFETLCRNGVELTAHADINDDGQTVTIKVPKLENPKTGDESNKRTLATVMSVALLGGLSTLYFFFKKKKSEDKE